MSSHKNEVCDHKTREVNGLKTQLLQLTDELDSRRYLYIGVGPDVTAEGSPSVLIDVVQEWSQQTWDQ